MVKFCVMRACANRDLKRIKGVNVKHHEFPASNDVRLQWESFANKYNRTVDWKAGAAHKSAFLCTEHFEENCYTEKGRLTKSALPTIAPKFTAEVALKWGLIPHLKSHILDAVNDFDKSLQDLCVLGDETVQASEDSDMVCEDLVEDPVTPVSSPTSTEAETLKMPIFIEKPRAPVEAEDWNSAEQMDECEGEGLRVENITDSDVRQPLLRQESSFDSSTVNDSEDSSFDSTTVNDSEDSSHDSTAVNYSEDSQKGSPVEGRKRYLGDLDAKDFKKNGEAKVNLVKCQWQKVKRKVKSLHQLVRRTRKRVIDLESLLKCLEEKHLISHVGSGIIKAKLNVISASLSTPRSVRKC